MQTSSSPSVSILPHSLVTRSTVRTSFPDNKSGQIFPSTPLRLWTRSSPWTTSSSASRKHQIWRRSSEVNDEERTTFYGTTLTNDDVKRFYGAKLGRDDRSALLAVQVRDRIYAGPRLQDDESLTEFRTDLICIQYLQFNSASTTTPG